ncbi:MAG: TonB-dependent receptor [Flammeovirgaceae bacterium]|nr:TonB-dependent receptor [Flammeovirgaceae bacterium]
MANIKKICIVFISLMLSSAMAFSQELTQTVRGTILDTDSQLPIIGATVTIINSNPLIGSVTNLDGNFRLEKVPTGRYNLQLSYLGYESQTISNIVVTSGKEVVLNFQMQESTVNMDEIVITANENKGEALNDLVLVSTHSISPEETTRFPGTFNDPSRVVSNFAGVTSTQDGSNDIIVRGNSPKYVQWRLEGIQITNPNHFADPAMVGGSISALNNNVLATSDFYTGAFTAEYGDVLSGVYDVKLRAGNNENTECVFGFGLLGTDFTVEGSFKKGYGGSYIVNYRYSTASMIQDLGLIDEVGTPKFQDASFKIVLPTEKLGTFSLFGLGGYSSFLFEDVKPDTWQTPGNRSMKAEIEEDFNKNAYLLNTGLNHTISINKNSFVNTTLSYSSEGIKDDIYESSLINIYNNEGQHLKDSVTNRYLNYKNRLTKITYRAAVTYNHKLDARNKIQVGSKYAYFDFDNLQSYMQEETGNRVSSIDFAGNISTIRNFISWKHRLNDKITIVSGLHNMNVLLNNKSTLEPRLAFNWKLNHTNSIHVGYGSHSTMEGLHHYFSKVKREDGSLVEPNKDLDLLKAHHFVVGYEKRISQNLMAKVEVYYQDLYNLPVENSDTSYFATINEGLDYRYVDLVNEGTGKNYGIEFTLERFFDDNYFFLINTSFFNSKYKTLEGIERNTRFNYNYLLNILIGKEFTHLGKKENKTLGLNAKIFFGGGQKYIPLLRDGNGNLAVDPEKDQYWDYGKAYNDKIEDIYQIILSASYKINKPKATHEIFLNLENITNQKGKLSEYYDESEPNSIGYLTQFGFFPNLMYRVYF